jgi:hypothetical protein
VCSVVPGADFSLITYGFFLISGSSTYGSGNSRHWHVSCKVTNPFVSCMANGLIHILAHLFHIQNPLYGDSFMNSCRSDAFSSNIETHMFQILKLDLFLLAK